MLYNTTKFGVPAPDEKIWRYMTVTELVSLVSKKSLFFSRVDKLNDPFEGSLPKATLVSAEKAMDRLTQKGQEILRETRQLSGYLQSKGEAENGRHTNRETAYCRDVFGRRRSMTSARWMHARRAGD